ncbi:hypothetical protein [Bacillus sp. Au-Bac7]|uniref:hypothetical protein n=1 Tax=Bacillus sp. Au-Bac7 TaxID=2906458 RepID=UPI001E2909F1|nr:hypothetical protein [Bacillus sp. Au-Bac7]MCE4051897.1 hypothetical protein [Bacillus sp. Au-Bac7]
MIQVTKVDKHDDTVKIFYEYTGDRINFNSYVELTENEYNVSTRGDYSKDEDIVYHLLIREFNWILSRDRTI